MSVITPPVLLCPCCGERLNGKLNGEKVLTLAKWIKRNKAGAKRRKKNALANRALYNWLRLKELNKGVDKMSQRKTEEELEKLADEIHNAIREEDIILVYAKDATQLPLEPSEIILIIKEALIKSLNA